MGDPYQFRSPLSVESEAPANPSTKAGTNNTESLSTASLLTRSPAQNVSASAPKNTIFGGSVFGKPRENTFAVAGTQSLFGGISPLNTAQQSNILKTDGTKKTVESSLFSRAQTNLPGTPSLFVVGPSKAGEEVSSASIGNIFGGSFASKASSFKADGLSDVTLKTDEASKPIQSSIFGGAYLQMEPSKTSDFYTSGKAQDDIHSNIENSRSFGFFGDQKKPSTISLNKQPSEKPSPIASRSVKEIIKRFQTRDVVSSSLSHDRKDKYETDLSYLPEDHGKLSNSDSVAQANDPDWEPDSMEGGNQKSDLPRSSSRSLKIVRKRAGLGRAVGEVSKLSGRDQSTEKSRSIQCCPLDGELDDRQVLKEYFSKFNAIRVSINKERRYVLASFKTHEDALKAMNGGSVIDGKKYKFFWRTVPKSRRSGEDMDKSKSSESTKQTIQSSKIELDPAVKEELEALSGIDYLMPYDSSSKRKSKVASEEENQSLSKSRVVGRASRGQEHRNEGSQMGERTNSHVSRLETNKLKPRTSKSPKEIKADKRSVSRPSAVFADRTSLKKAAAVQAKESKSEQEEHKSSDNVVGSTALASELIKILKKQVTSAEDKLQVLDARDKLIRLKQVKQYDISKAVKTVGTCPDMCPEKERLLRETRRQISQYEMSASNISEIDPNLMVKQYSRSSADQEEPLPHELRPPAILTMTMNYLMHTVMNLGDQPGENLGEWYHFLWDRLRGIRKEITQQELCDPDAVSLVEQCARFHIHCGARLVAEDMSVFDDRINTENLTKCLQTLKHMYHDLWINNSTTCPNEPEFITYFILLNLNNGTIMWEMEQLREEVLESPEISFVAAMYSSLSSNNFVRFFRLVRKASYLNSCLCIRYFYQVRSQALNTYVKALAKLRPVMYPLASLVDDLGFENADRAAAFCSHHGLQVENNLSDSAVVILSQETFFNPNSVLPSERACKLVESKRIGTVGNVVNGGLLPPRLYEGHSVHNSFDRNGLLRKVAFFAKDQGLMDIEVKDGDIYEDIEEIEGAVTMLPSRDTNPKVSLVTDDKQSSEFPPQATSSIINFGDFVNQKQVFSPAFANLHPGSTASSSISTNQTIHFSTPPHSAQTSFGESEAMKPLFSLVPKVSETNKLNVFPTLALQSQAKLDAERKDQEEREREMAVQEAAEIQMNGLIDITVHEVTAEAAMEEYSKAEEQVRAEEQQRAEEQLQAQEDLRKRILDTHLERISNDAVDELLNEEIEILVLDLAQDVHTEEENLFGDIEIFSDEALHSLVFVVSKEECTSVAIEEMKIALKFARQEAVELRVRQIFHHWLERARLSLHRKHVMTDFPAGIIPLSLKEHAERWGFPTEDLQGDLKEVRYKRQDKSFDVPDLKSIVAYPQTTFAELVGIQAVHRYDIVRAKLGLRPTDQLLYKLFISVPDESQDPSLLLVDWWMRRTFKQTCSMVYDDASTGVYRLVSGLRVTSDLVVYASLQLVRGERLLAKQHSLASGISAILFTVSPASNIQASRMRLTTLLRSVSKFSAVPLVITIVCPVEPPLEGLKQLVLELELDQWLEKGVICDYQILHVVELYDVKYLSERFNMALNYMVMTWTPSPEYSLVTLKNILKSTFQMFYISIQFNHNSSELYPQDVDDPRVIMGLCNEWLDRMSQEFLASYHEARDLCGCEFWPLLHKGAFLPFFHDTNYEQCFKEIIQDMFLPPLEWPPSSEIEFEKIFEEYCSWLRPDEEKQTLKRLSLLNGLTWPEKLNAVPWINLVEDWMEARMHYANTSRFGGTEMLCLMRAQNVEYLYSYPWWAQSRHITSYLESHRNGKENEMDVDQNFEFDDPEDEVMDIPKKMTSGAGSGLLQLQEVKNCVSELKNANEVFVSRLKSALAEDPAQCESIIQIHKVGSASDKTITENSPLIDSLAKSIDLHVQAQRDTRSHISHILTSALAEDHVVTGESLVNQPNSEANIEQISANKQSLVDPLSKSEDDVGTKNSRSSKKMDEIMSSMEALVASLNKKYNIMDSTSNSEKITDLKMGFGEGDAEHQPTGILEHSSYVEESQLRMRKRLHKETTRDDKKRVVEKPLNYDSDLEVVSDEGSESTHLRSTASPSSLENYSDCSRSDYGNDDYPSRKRRCLSNDGNNASYEESDQSALDSESDFSEEEEEVQTISSEDSTEHAVSQLHHNFSSESPTQLHEMCSAGAESTRALKSDLCDADLLIHNGHLGSQNEVREPMTTYDNFLQSYEHYGESEVIVSGQEPEVLDSAEVGFLRLENVRSEAVLSLNENSEGITNSTEVRLLPLENITETAKVINENNEDESYQAFRGQSENSEDNCSIGSEVHDDSSSSGSRDFTTNAQRKKLDCGVREEEIILRHNSTEHTSDEISHHFDHSIEPRETDFIGGMGECSYSEIETYRSLEEVKSSKEYEEESDEENEDECAKEGDEEYAEENEDESAKEGDEEYAEENEDECAKEGDEENAEETDEDCANDVEEECAEEDEEECAEEDEEEEEEYAEEEDGEEECVNESFEDRKAGEEELMDEGEEEESGDEVDEDDEVESEPDEDSDICEIIDDD